MGVVALLLLLLLVVQLSPVFVVLCYRVMMGRGADDLQTDRDEEDRP